MLIKINGRTKYFERITAIKKVSAARWNVTMCGRDYQVEGGKAAGGSARDWFVDGFGGKAIPASSLVDALNLIENA